MTSFSLFFLLLQNILLCGHVGMVNILRNFQTPSAHEVTKASPHRTMWAQGEDGNVQAPRWIIAQTHSDKAAVNYFCGIFFWKLFLKMLKFLKFFLCSEMISTFFHFLLCSTSLWVILFYIWHIFFTLQQFFHFSLFARWESFFKKIIEQGQTFYIYKFFSFFLAHHSH